jgi:Beta-propeller repeat
VGTAEKDSVMGLTKRSAPAKAMKTAILAVAILSAAGSAFYFSTVVRAAKGTAPGAGQASKSNTHSNTRQTALSLPLFFEPNQGQSAPQVKFLAHGAGYGLFLTAGEAVLKLHRPQASSQIASQLSVENAKRDSGSVIRMRLEGATYTAQVSGDARLPGKSDYFIGNDPSKWHQGIPQFARVQYQAVYPGVDLIYYGNQGQLEYDFRVAPGADPRQITLSFKGATAHVDSKGISGGDLVLSTHDGEVRFQTPRIYQRSDSPGGDKKEIAGSFRQLADNKIGFTIGSYDHSRELVIDPMLNYSTYLGGSGTESNVKIAVDSAGTIYVGGSTDSTDFPRVPNPGTTSLTGTENIFISKISPASPGGTASLLYSAYFGGTGPGTDTLAGIAVDQSASIYLAGSTTSQNFPTTSNAFQPNLTGFPANSHGFLSKISLGLNSVYAPAYSTYLAGNGIDTVTGLAIDTNQNAYVTGHTTSTNAASNTDGFPANPNGFQTVSNYPIPDPGNFQFFASKINTNGSGQLSMIYSTYFGGGYPAGATAVGGGIAVDTAGSAPNMYITGTTNMPPGRGPNNELGFPLYNPQQACLNEDCSKPGLAPYTDAFVAKINPNVAGSVPIYSTYLGGGGTEFGTAVAADTSGNAYVTGSTNSTNWSCTSCSVGGFQTLLNGTGATSLNTDAFIAKVGNIVGSTYPMTYFTYLGGSGDETGAAIVVDSVQAAHVTGWTTSTDLPITTNASNVQVGNGGGFDAFAASISTTLSGKGAGDLLTYLGGSGADQGTGVAIDVFGNTYIAGTTNSTNFPTKNPYQPALNGPADAFVSQIVSVSNLTVAPTTTSPTPNPVAAGTQVAFTFSITNNATNKSTDVANLVVFNALGLPTSGLASTPTAKVTSGSGSCGTVQGSTISCNIPTLAVGAVATVEVDMTPAVPVVNKTITISGNASANGGPFSAAVQQPVVNVVDFTISASPTAQTINAGDTATFQVIFSPTSSGYNATITPSQTTSPSIVTAIAPTFNPTTIPLSGSGSATTLLSIPTVARPVNTGSLLRRGSFYAAWLPIGGLTLAGLGIGVGKRRRRWVIGAVLMLIAGTVVLQSACGSSSSTNTTSGGTQAGTYIVTVSGSAGSAASHTYQITLTVN